MLTITLGIQEVPPDHRGGYELASDEVTVEAASYEEGVAEATKLIPEGWRKIFVRTGLPDQ
ncbi:hypothetical protein [Nocardioides sp. Leaf285]|uniref:hypothetical protein n=1 Tax=Nocardioides sp. Leaf285 TaxID=1736322 RepID=UPI00070301DA|nr:hypothetical protein [Nocardioides sp. Leaf285]KQP62886.1 hypothetical protein ASF47_17900 [Nocardioides sp. Leaf285]